MSKILLFIIISLVLIACSNEPEKINDFLNNKKLSNQKKLALIFKYNYLDRIGFNKKEVDWLKEIYKLNKNKPLFCNDSNLTKLGLLSIESVKEPLSFGIPKNRLKANSNKRDYPLLNEIYLCINSSRIFYDLNNGIINFEKKIINPSQLIHPHEFISKINQLNISSLNQLFLNQGPTDTNYRFLASQIYIFCKSYPLDTCTYDLNLLDKEEVTNSLSLKNVLFSKGYLKSKNVSDEELKNSLNRFQRDNGLTEEIKINTNTITALSESNKTKIIRAAISLDKIRQSKIHQAKYVRINIPEYKLYFYANDSLKSMHRIIVGKNTSQTPELTSKINKIIAFPFWKVPYSICKDEALPAIKKNIAYLNNNHYKIYKDTVEINPAKINWKKMTYFPYILIQQPGNFNSLGIMKFEFANNFSVYVHDTPSKSLFNRSVRNFSHGCMRCENPLKLGRIMLENDIVGNKPTKFTSDFLDTVMHSQLNKSIFLKVSIPIYVYYQTVVADRNKLVFYLDIYKRDDEYLNLLKTAS